MAENLNGKKVAILATDGYEQAELDEPKRAVEDAGAETEVISPKTGEIQGMNHLDKGDTIAVDRAVADASVDDYDGLVLPGGVANPDNLRQDEDTVRFVQEFFKTGKPVAAICHAPWLLVEADVVEGRTLTSYPSIRTDIRNAGATVVDEEVVIDGNLISSRSPDDLPHFATPSSMRSPR